MHPRLLRQLRKLGVDARTPPGAALWTALLAQVSTAFEAEDHGRRLCRSMKITSRALAQQVAAQSAVVKMLQTQVRERTQALEAALARLATRDALPVGMGLMSERLLAHAEEMGSARLAAVQDKRDIEARDDALFASEQRLRALLDGTPDRVWMKDQQGRYIVLNRSAELGLGLPAAQILGRTERELPTVEHAEQEMADDARVLAEGRPLRIEGMTDSSGRWREIIKAPIMGADGAVAGMVGIARDITERRAREEERRAREREQHRVFVREIHHRIKNHVQGVAGLLMGHARREPALGQTIHEAIAQLQAVAVVHGLQGATDERPNFPHLVSAICDARRTQGAGTVHIEYSCPLQDEHRIDEADAVPVALIVNELLVNAVKHMPRAQNVQVVRVEMSGLADGVRLAIDNPGSLAAGYEHRRKGLAGSGLGIARALLPAAGARLEIAAHATGVRAILELRAPVIVAAERSVAAHSL